MNKRQYKKLRLKPYQKWLTEFVQIMNCINYEKLKRAIENVVANQVISLRPYYSKFASLSKPQPDYSAIISKVEQEMKEQRQATLKPYWSAKIDLTILQK